MAEAAKQPESALKNGLILKGIDEELKDFMGEPILFTDSPIAEPKSQSLRKQLCWFLGQYNERDALKRTLQFDLALEIAKAEGPDVPLEETKVKVLKDVIENFPGSNNLVKGTVLRKLE